MKSSKQTFTVLSILLAVSAILYITQPVVNKYTLAVNMFLLGAVVYRTAELYISDRK
ncbi:MAG: hypothetical protein QM571_07375 [Micrococcaceae bacterium]